jgi:hypothetical protein
MKQEKFKRIKIWTRSIRDWIGSDMDQNLNESDLDQIKKNDETIRSDLWTPMDTRIFLNRCFI